MTYYRRINKWLLAIIVCSPLLFLQFTTTDSGNVDSRLESAFDRALLTFALARTLNGVISVAQGTVVALEPAGIGVNLAPGQILDPVNDLVEKFADIMLLSTISLGVQQILLEISSQSVFNGVYYLITVLVLLSLVFFRERLVKISDFLFRLLLFVVILRFAIPVNLLVTDYLFDTFLLDRYETASSSLVSINHEVQATHETIKQEKAADESWVEGLSDYWSRKLNEVSGVKKIEQYRSQLESIPGYIIELILVFVFQTVIMPILVLWLFLKMLRHIGKFAILRPGSN